MATQTAYSTALDNFSNMITKTAQTLYATRASVIAVRNQYNPPAPVIDNAQGRLNQAWDSIRSSAGNNTGLIMVGLALALAVGVFLWKRG